MVLYERTAVIDMIISNSDFCYISELGLVPGEASPVAERLGETFVITHQSPQSVGP